MAAKFFLWCAIALNLSTLAISWDSEDFELFDLVEEINRNFYDALGVSASTDSAELKRAYRRLSLQLHPDKNKEQDADVQFRQLVAMYEVLKDARKRARYDEILANGLPDWKQPVFYYRRVRKMGLLELAVLLAIILTVGQFITIWSIYFERRFEKEEVLRSRKKRDKKGRRSRQADSSSNIAVDDDDDASLEAELSCIRRPQLSDLLPCLVVRLVSQLAVTAARGTADSVREWCTPRVVEDESAGDDTDYVRTFRKKPVVSMSPVIVETLPFELPSMTLQPLHSLGEQSTDNSKVARQGCEWSEAEIALLAKAMARYPGGVTDRWEKIAHMVGRSVREVSAMSREVKAHCMRAVDPSTQGITANVLMDSNIVTLPDDLTTRDDDNAGPTVDEIYCEHVKLDSTATATNNASVKNPPKSSVSTAYSSTTRHRRKPVALAAARNIDRTLMIAQLPPSESEKVAMKADEVKGGAGGSMVVAWSQQQQRLLETALNQFPKGSADRWDRVAESVPGKTKDECIQRFKYLADVVKRKQQEKLQQQQTCSDY